MRHMRHVDPADHAEFGRFLCAKRGPEARNHVFHVSHVHRKAKGRPLAETNDGSAHAMLNH